MMSDSVARALRLLGLLQRCAFWPGPVLADALKVTPRTLRRDIDRLRRLGYAIEADRGVGGGYALASGRRLPPLVLSDEAVAAIVLGLRAAVGSSIVGIESIALEALTQLEAVLPTRLRERVAEMSASVVWAAERTEARVEMSTLLTLAAAHRARRCARFGYTRGDGEESEREVEVGHIVPDGRRWYMVGWDLNRDDWRTFRLDRMGAVSIGERAVSVGEHAMDAEEARAQVRAGRSRAAEHTAVVRVVGSIERVRACVLWLRHEIVVEEGGAVRVVLHNEHPSNLVATIAALASDPSLVVEEAQLDAETEAARASLVDRLAGLGGSARPATR